LPRRLRLATWNVNSLRLRAKHLERLVAEHKPDVLCMQEIKVADEHFPHQVLRDLGFAHIAVAGQRMWHGVAIASTMKLERVTRRSWCGKDDARHIAARLPGGIELHNFYVPAGGDIPDPVANDKFAHKLNFLAEMTQFFSARGQAKTRQILVGDLNVAPLPTDVWSHKQLLKVVSHTRVEVAAFERLQASRLWVDAVRRFVPPEKRLYTWWSYRAQDWEKSDRGRRLDHVWVTPALQASLRGAKVLKTWRGMEPASDHVPVVVDLAL
jgi:exodeoxyribonuclease III